VAGVKTAHTGTPRPDLSAARRSRRHGPEYTLVGRLVTSRRACLVLSHRTVGPETVVPTVQEVKRRRLQELCSGWDVSVEGSGVPS